MDKAHALMHVVAANSSFRFIREASVRAAERFEDGSLSFVFIDGAHEHGAVAQDLEAWWPKVAVGGIFAGHDYTSLFDVPKALHPFLLKKAHRFCVADRASTASFYLRKYAPT